MIPTLLIAGYVAALFSRGRLVILVATASWILILAVSGLADGLSGLIAGGLLAAANTALGVLVGHYSLKLSCYLRGRPAARPPN
jgi:hypothetical protein